MLGIRKHKTHVKPAALLINCNERVIKLGPHTKQISPENHG